MQSRYFPTVRALGSVLIGELQFLRTLFVLCFATGRARLRVRLG